MRSAAQATSAGARGADGDTSAASTRAVIDSNSAEFFRGDSWQCLLIDPRWALRVAVLVRVTLLSTLKVDSRVSIGIGGVESVSPDRISLSRGEAFTLSGDGLDRKMGSRYRLAISVPDAWSRQATARDGEVEAATGKAVDAGSRPANLTISGPWLDTVARLCDSVVGQWEGRQLEVARLLCLHPAGITQAEIGQRLDPPVSQQAVAKVVQSAGWHGIEDALERFESETWSAARG